MNTTFPASIQPRSASKTDKQMPASAPTRIAKTAVAAAVAAFIAGVSSSASATPVAKIDDTTFDTIKAALNADVDGKTIVLLTDIGNESGYALGASAATGFNTTAKNVTIDLSGHSYSVTGSGAGSQGTESQAFQLLREAGSVTFKNGTLHAKSRTVARVIQNYADLTLDNITVDGTTLANSPNLILSFNCGDSLIKDSNIINKQGDTAFDVFFWPDGGYGEGVSVTVENSTIGGQIDVSTDGTSSNIGKKHALKIVGGTLSANDADTGGKIKTEGYTTIESTTLAGNSAKYNGGAIYNKGDKTLAGELTITNVAFDGNKATRGGAIYSYGGSVSINGTSSFTKNEGTAVFAFGATVTLNAENAQDVISFADNTPSTYGNGGTDLNLASASTATLRGKGTITFGGSISSDAASSMESSAAAVSIADASKFLGAFTLKDGLTTVGGYFGGNVTLEGGTLDIQSVTLSDDTLAKTTLTGEAALYGKVAQFLSGELGEDGLGKDAGELNLHGLTAESGRLILASDGLYNLDYLSSAQKLMAAQQVGAQLVMRGELVAPTEESTFTITDLDSVGDVILSQVTADADDKNLVIGSSEPSTQTETHRAESLGIAALSLGSATDVTVTGEKTLTLVGSGADKELVTSDAAARITLTNGNLVIGGDQNGTKGGTLSAEVAVGAGSTMSVKGSADFKLSSVSLTESTAKVELTEKADVELSSANVEAGTLVIADADAVISKVSLGNDGIVDVRDLAEAEIEELAGSGVINVGSATSSGRLTVRDASSHTGLIFVDPAWASDDSLNTVYNASGLEIHTTTGNTISSRIITSTNALVSLGAGADEAMNAFNAIAKAQGITWRETGAALYIGAPVIVTGGILVNEGAVASDAVTANTVKIDKGMLIVNQAAMGSAPAIEGEVVLTANAALGLANARDGILTLASEGFSAEDGARVLTDNPFLTAELADAAAGTVAVHVDAENGVGTLASTGIQAMTRRADLMFSQTVADRTAIDQNASEGLSLWVDVIGERYASDALDNGGSFKADAGYSVFGADLAVANGITVGGALQYGTASLRSDVANIRNDIDSFGVAAYGSKAFGNAKVVADLAFVKSNNDISSSQTAMNQKVDASQYSLGLTAQYKVTAGSFQFVPSVGLRISRLETDDMAIGAVNTGKQKQTLVQVPIAMRINANDMTAQGWNLAPSFKVAYIPAYGDKDITVLGVSQDVIDASPVQADFGLRAVKGDVMLQGNMIVGGGTNGTSSIGAKIGLRYAF